MVQFVNEIDIAASPESVFNELSDLRNELRWSPKMRSVTLLSGEPISVGSRLEARWSGTPRNQVVYTAFEFPKRWGAAYRSWPMIVEATLELTPIASGTRLTSNWKLTPRGPLRLLARPLARSLSRDVANSMRQAKEHVEGLHTRPQSSSG